MIALAAIGWHLQNGARFKRLRGWRENRPKRLHGSEITQHRHNTSSARQLRTRINSFCWIFMPTRTHHFNDLRSTHRCELGVYPDPQLALVGATKPSPSINKPAPQTPLSANGSAIACRQWSKGGSEKSSGATARWVFACSLEPMAFTGSLQDITPMDQVSRACSAPLGSRLPKALRDLHPRNLTTRNRNPLRAET